MKKAIGAVALALAVISFSGAAEAQVKAGALSCDVSGGFGWIIGSVKTVSCLFTPDNGAPREAYQGTIRKFGLDIGVTTRQLMVWGVFAGTSYPPGGRAGLLAGDYVGATGEATVAVGLGGNVLVGGSNRSVALQPLSVTGQTGLNVAAGVADLQLRPVGR
jgi:hypothetical protein